jgi:hypothetical protein
MKLSYFLVADAANDLGGKTNALGLGVRLVTPTALPSLTPLALLALAEATETELGEQPIRISLETPSGRRLPLVEDTVTVTDRPDRDPDLPIEVKVSVSFPFVAETEGVYTLRLRLGAARGAYRLIVRHQPQEGTADTVAVRPSQGRRTRA